MTGPNLLGQTLGNYRVDSLMGAGGMGRVYRGTHLLLNRPVAIKVMHDNLAADPGFRARFLQEAKAAANLNHANIVQVYDFGEESGRFFLVMELLNGGSIRTLLQQANGQPLPLPLATSLVRQIASGLDYAHRQAMVHRDIKPDNLLLNHRDDYSGTFAAYGVKITDFGLARLTEGDIVTAASFTMGTPAYMSPEQAMGTPLDGRSDLYSLGVVLYEVVTGFQPFQVNSLSAAVYKHVNVVPTPPRNLNPDIPVELEQVVMRCLAKHREERYDDCAELASAIAGLQIKPDSDRWDVISDATGQSPAAVAPANAGIPATEMGESPNLTEIGGSPVAEFVTLQRGARGSDKRLPSDAPMSSAAVPQIRVMEDQKIIYQVALGTDGLSFGRSPENDVTLAKNSVSRRHLKIDWNGNQVTITDLGSGNGTFVANRRIPANVPQIWNPAEQIRVGPYWLQIRLPDTLQSLPPDPLRSLPPDPLPTFAQDLAVNQPGVNPPASHEETSAVGLKLEKDELTIVPGQRQTLSVTVANLGRLVAHADVSVEGVPGQWVIVPPTTQLLPSAQSAVTMVIDVPRSPSSRSGEYPVTIGVVATREGSTSSGSERDVASAPALWTVLPFAESSLSLQPQRRSGRMRARFGTMLTNSGNSEAAYSLTGHDEDEALGFDFKPPEVTLDPGEERTVGVEVSSNPRWFGRPQSRRFSVRSASYSEPQPKSATAEFVQLALIPIWLPVVLLLVAGALGVIIPQLLHVDAPVIEDPSFTPSDQVPAMQPVTITWRVSNATSLSVPTFNMSLDLSPQNRVLNSNGTWIIERDSSNGQMIHMDAQSVAGLNGDKNIVTVELTFQTGLDHTQQFVLIAKNSKHESRKQQTLTITSPPATPTASAAAAGAGVSAATPSRTWNFANDSGDWFIGKAPRFSASIANGAYSVVVATGSLNEVIPPNSVTVADDERIAADTTLQQGSVGLVVRYTTTGSDKARTFYDCFVDTDDQFTCGAMIQDKYSVLVQPTKSGAIKHGQTNHLQLTAIGDKISFTINETTVSEFSDSQITQGSIALEINSTATDPGTGTFANVEEYLNR